MKHILYAGVAALALNVGMASAEQVTVFGPWLGPDQDNVEAVLAEFAKQSGNDVRYVGSDSFEQQIRVDVEAGSAPNIAVFPQPGLAADMAKGGFLTPLADGTADWVRKNYAAGQSWVDLGTYAGADGKKDLYDWVEDLMLRTQPPAVYDDWVSNKMPFNDPRVIAAIKEFGWFARNDAYVAGGAGAVASTDFRDSPKGMFSSPPQCYMHRQASFIPAFFPDGTVVGQDADFFYFPAYASKDLGKPVLGAGTVWAITSDSPGAQALIKFLETPKAHEIWMARKGFLTPLKSVNTDVFGDPTLKKMNDILLNATTFRFDGSDLMPGAVGAGSFWTGMVDYAGGKSASDVANEIQASWDAIK